MKGLFNIVVMSVFAGMVSCGKSSDLFIVSGYSGDNKPDVSLCKLGSKGIPEVLNEFTCGNNPSFFTVGDSGLIYIANEVDSFMQKKGGGITTLYLDPGNNTLKKVGEINQGAPGPCHILLSSDRRYLITANYGSGKISVVKLDKKGIPSEVTDVIGYGDKSHPHMTWYNERNGIYYVTDLGLDRIYLFKLNTETGRLLDAATAYVKTDTGSGPRHMALDKDCRNLYVINELNSTISVFDALRDIPVFKNSFSTLPEGFNKENFCADIHFSPDEKMIYGSNRGDNSIAVFRVSRNGSLSPAGYSACGGNWPRNFAISPDGRYMLVANQRSDTVSVLGLKNRTGVPEPAGQSLSFKAPSCIRFLQ